MTNGLDVDLVLEGGGVKGIALVGAVGVLLEQGYTIHKVAGTSAGAVVGSLVALALVGPAGRAEACGGPPPRDLPGEAV